MKFKYWQVPRQVLRETEAAFRAGQHEVFAIWTAQAALENTSPSTARAQITRCIIPVQTPGATPQGVFVHIEGRELQRIQLDNYARKERSVVQLHTHPGEDVRMSLLDRKWEVVRHVGALSIIVPFYGTHGLDAFRGVNVYERDIDEWRLWSRREVEDRLVIV